MAFIEKLYRHPSRVTFDVGNTLNERAEHLQEEEVSDEDEFEECANDDNNLMTNDYDEPRNDGEGCKRQPWISGYFYETTQRNKRDSDNSGANEPRQASYGRHVVQPERFGDMTQFAFLTAEALCGNRGEEDPLVAENAIEGAHRKYRKTSMAEAIASQVDNDVLDIVKKPNSRKVIPSK